MFLKFYISIYLLCCAFGFVITFFFEVHHVHNCLNFYCPDLVIFIFTGSSIFSLYAFSKIRSLMNVPYSYVFIDYFVLSWNLMVLTLTIFDLWNYKMKQYAKIHLYECIWQTHTHVWRERIVTVWECVCVVVCMHVCFCVYVYAPRESSIYNLPSACRAAIMNFVWHSLTLEWLL